MASGSVGDQECMNVQGMDLVVRLSRALVRGFYCLMNLLYPKLVCELQANISKLRDKQCSEKWNKRRVQCRQLSTQISIVAVEVN